MIEAVIMAFLVGLVVGFGVAKILEARQTLLQSRSRFAEISREFKQMETEARQLRDRIRGNLDV